MIQIIAIIIIIIAIILIPQKKPSSNPRYSIGPSPNKKELSYSTLFILGIIGIPVILAIVIITIGSIFKCDTKECKDNAAARRAEEIRKEEEQKQNWTARDTARAIDRMREADRLDRMEEERRAINRYRKYPD